MFVSISAGYMNALHIPVVRGRDFSDTDIAGRPAVVLISESMARQFWPGEDALGKRLTLTFFPDAVREVVGIVGDVKLDGLDQTRPSATLYFPLDQVSVPATGGWNSFPMTLVVRSASAPRDGFCRVECGARGRSRNAVARHPDDGRPGCEILVAAAVQYAAARRIRRAGPVVGGGGHLQRVVLQRETERARTSESVWPWAPGVGDVLRMVVFEGMKPTLLGVAIGVVGALALGRVLSGLIYGVKPTDPVTFIAVARFARTDRFVVASIIPAYRATKVDPMVALRYE